MKLRKDLKEFLDLFENHQPDYDVYNHEKLPALSVYMENFERKAQELEDRYDLILCPKDPEEEESKDAGKFMNTGEEDEDDDDNPWFTTVTWKVT